MDSQIKDKTLRLEKPSGKTFWLTFLLILLFFGMAEGIVRLEFFQSPLTPPQMGSRHYQLGHKLALLDASIRKYGAVDCVMVGNSMVGRAFNPEVFQNAFRETTGLDIHCFNFGINASSAVSAEVLAELLIQEYSPRLLIIGTDPRDYALSPEDPDVISITDSSWIRYRLGDFSLDGWLTEISYLYRYRQHLSNLFRFRYKDTLWSDTKLNFPVLSNGFTPIDEVNTRVNRSPGPHETTDEIEYYKRIYTSYRMLDENLSALEEIMEYNGAGTQVIIVEMPVADGLYYFFGNGRADYNRYIEQVGDFSARYQVSFWQTEPVVSIPYDGWSDYIHLNTKGAETFSIWLGQQVGDLYSLGNMSTFQQ